MQSQSADVSAHSVIEVRNLTKIYSNGVNANVKIDLKVKQREIFGIVGPNGAGKTTLVRQMTGELLPTNGEIWVNGINVIDNPNEVKKIAGICPQEASLFGYLTVKEHLYYFARLKGLEKTLASERVNEVLKDLNLGQHKNKSIAELSGGLKRKVFMALAILDKPQTLFLDEPTTGLDPESRRDVWRLLGKIIEEKGATIILTTHYMEEAERFCSRIAIINKGRIVAEGTPEQLQRKLKYDLKLRAPQATVEKVGDMLGKIDHKIVKTGNYAEVYLNREEARKVKLEELMALVDSESEIVFMQPSLEDVYLEVIRHEDVEDTK